MTEITDVQGYVAPQIERREAPRHAAGRVQQQRIRLILL